MAEVFLGSSVGAEGFTRRVAIKRVLPELSDNSQFAQMFVIEAQISARLVHSNIVSVIDFDRDRDNRLFLVMELVEGRDLDTLMTSGPLPFPVIIFVVTEILHGLGHAHEVPVGNGLRGLVHRDVSPHNVLLSWEGSVKVSDFGIAKARTASVATASAFIKGKPAYMSPEQARGDALDGRSDLFAVGVMLWEMLVGKRLFIAADTHTTLAAVLFGPIAHPRLLRPNVPKDLERVALKLLERDLSRRYSTAQAAILDLLECRDAPKAGREALMATLAERFPRDAPQRGNVQRPPSVPPPAAPNQQVAATPQSRAHGASPGAASEITLQDGAPGRHQSRPPASLSAVMSARTGTAYRPKPSRRHLWPALVAVALAVVGTALGVARLKAKTPKIMQNSETIQK